MATGEPLSDKRLEKWRADALEARRVLSGSLTIPRDRLDTLTAEYAERYAARLPDLVAEIERLRAQLTATIARPAPGRE